MTLWVILSSRPSDLHQDLKRQWQESATYESELERESGESIKYPCTSHTWDSPRSSQSHWQDLWQGPGAENTDWWGQETWVGAASQRYILAKGPKFSAQYISSLRLWRQPSLGMWRMGIRTSSREGSLWYMSCPHIRRYSRHILNPTDVAKDDITHILVSLATATVDGLWSKNKKGREAWWGNGKTHMTELMWRG